MKKSLSIFIVSAVVLSALFSVLYFSGVLTKEYIVTFYSNDGTVLMVDRVKRNSSATPPSRPNMTYGSIFKCWDTDFSKVTEDLDVHPSCETIKDKPNVIAIHSSYVSKDSSVTIPIQLCGDVCLSGLDITIYYDENLIELESITEDKSVVINGEIPGRIKLNYISVENTVADVDIANLQFYVKAKEGNIIPISVEINGIYAFDDDLKKDKLIATEATIINGTIYVLK